MDETCMTLLETWTGQDVTGWIASEKHDGCRAYWDGERLWSRGGRVIPAPEWFTRQLPQGVHLDGELWAGRGNFQQARLAAQYGHWTSRIMFVVFDTPQASGRWQDRLQEAALALVASEVAQVVEHWTVLSSQNACTLFAELQAGGGEGLVLRNPEAEGYETGRTVNALKVRRLPRGLRSG